MSGRASFSTGAKPPRKTHWQWSEPLENDHRPETLKPPSTRSILPVGAYDEEISAEESFPHTSSWAFGEKRASCQLWAVRTPRTHAVEGQAAESAKGLSPEGASVLYRVAQEAVRNALQHAGARRIALRVSDGGGAVAVRISDDGCGFDLAEAERRRPGMGLFTMRERTTLVGGQFDVVTSEGQGTSVLARIPVAGVGTN